MRTISSTHRKHFLAPAALLLTTVAFQLALAPSGRSQSVGYSYLRMEIGGHPMTNFVHDEKHQGWLQIFPLEAKLNSQPANGTSKKKKSGNAEWSKLPAILKSGHSGPGELDFGAGDDGGLDPLLEAQKRKTLIPQAELDLYNEETSDFIAKFTITGVRILAVEDVPASACAMYSITLSFQSIEKK
ncbi:MAG: hypothetical protein ACRD5M_12290 [Candidatus Acidiferrales bacterium]